MPACVKLRANGTFSILTIRVRLSAIPAVHKLHRETSEVLRSCTCTTGHIRMPAGYNRKPAPVQRPVSATDAGKNGGAGGSSAPETPEQVFTPKQDRRGSRSLDEVRCRFSCSHMALRPDSLAPGISKGFPGDQSSHLVLDSTKALGPVHAVLLPQSRHPSH